MFCLCYAYNCTGYLMRCTNEAVQMQICTTILQIYTNKSPGNEVQRLCPCSYQFSRMIVERSDVSETLVKVSLNSFNVCKSSVIKVFL